MSTKRDLRVYIEDILKSVTLLLQYTKDIANEKQLEESEMSQDAIIRRFEIIGEAALQLPEIFKNKYSQIAWRDMTDMRNKLIHEYFEADWQIIWKTIKEDLPQLKKQLEEILDQIEE